MEPTATTHRDGRVRSRPGRLPPRSGDPRHPPAHGRLVHPFRRDRLARAGRRGGRARPRRAARLGGARLQGALPVARSAARLDVRQRGLPRGCHAGRDRQGQRRTPRWRCRSSVTSINFWGERAAGYLADETPSSHNPLFKVKRLRITYRPYPVVGVISPWNFPLILAYDDAIPALMAGSAVVIKPSRGDAADRDGGCPRVEGDRRPGRDRGRERHRRHRRRADRQRRLRPVHRLGAHRQDRHEAGCRHAHPGQPRAGWQGSDDRPTRREPRPRRQRRCLRRPREHRPDLHGDRARLRRGADLRGVRDKARRPGAGAPPGARRRAHTGRTSAR